MNCVEENYIKLKPLGQRFSSTAAAAATPTVMRFSTMNLDLIKFFGGRLHVSRASFC